MPYNLLLLPLMGGFLFLHVSHLHRYRAQRLENYRLLFESAVVGTVLLTVARFLIVVGTYTPAAHWLAYWWGVYSPFANGDTAAMALLLGPLSAWWLNLRISKLEAKRRAVAKHGDLLLKLLSAAEQRDQMISVTLANSKWYVGFVRDSPSLDPQERYFQVLPVMSGYRKRDTLETVPIVFYDDALRAVQSEELAITLPLADVKIANMFDVDRYYDLFANPTPKAPDGDNEETT